MQLEQNALEKKNQELADAFREKAKNQQQLQKLYTALKQQQLAAGMELAAEHDAEHVLNTVAAGSYTTAHHRDAQPPRRSGSNGSGGRPRVMNRWEQPYESRAHVQTSRMPLLSFCFCDKLIQHR